MLLLSRSLPQGNDLNSGSLSRTSNLKSSLGLSQTQSPQLQVKFPHSACQDVARASFFNLDDIEVIEIIGSTFGPELEYLKSAASTLEPGSLKARGAFGSQEQTPSELLYGLDFFEVSRTIVSVLSLKWLVAGEYETFTRHQEPNARLSSASFLALRGTLLESLRTHDEVYALIVATVINDLGKSLALWDEIKPQLAEGKRQPNHDEIVYHAVRFGKVPLIFEFSKESLCRTSLMLGLSLGSSLNIAQLSQGENVPASLAAIRRLQTNKHAFVLKFFEIIFDVAGAQGHVESRSCITITEPLYLSFTGIRQTLADLMGQNITLKQAYDQVLQGKAALLSEKGFRKLSTDRPRERALLRLFCMGRVSSPERANVFDAAFSSLDPDIQSSLVNGLSVDGVDDGTAIIPYYAPALFAMAYARFQQSSITHLIGALAALMLFLNRVYRGSRPEPGNPGKVVECDLRFAQGTLKSETFLATPQILGTIEIPLESYGESIALEEIAKGCD